MEGTNNNISWKINPSRLHLSTLIKIQKAIYVDMQSLFAQATHREHFKGFNFVSNVQKRLTKPFTFVGYKNN